MAQGRTEKRVVVAPHADDVSAGVARRLLNRLERRTAAGKTTHIAFSGGRTATAFLDALGHAAPDADVDWSRVHVWWVDELFVSSSRPDRNAALTRVAFLDRVPIPAENVHAMPAADEGMDLDAAAAAYTAELERFSAPDHPWPKFHVCFLGIGADGHIAALFPDRWEIQEIDQVVVPVRDAPAPPPERLTLTRPVINSARSVWLVLTGAQKAPALGLTLAGASYDSVPAAGAKGRHRTVFFVDQDAAANVPEELIDPEF